MKYKLTNTTKIVNGVTLYQIQALKDFSDVKKGDIGGWIQAEKNLSQENNCWVWGDALVYGDARVYNDALVYGDAWVWGDANVSGKAQVSGNARVYDDARVSGNAQVSGKARIGLIEINFNLEGDFNEILKALFQKNNLPILLGIHPDLDKIIAYKLSH